jgi:hypothetical protein
MRDIHLATGFTIVHGLGHNAGFDRHIEAGIMINPNSLGVTLPDNIEEPERVYSLAKKANNEQYIKYMKAHFGKSLFNFEFDPYETN